MAVKLGEAVVLLMADKVRLEQQLKAAEADTRRWAQLAGKGTGKSFIDNVAGGISGGVGAITSTLGKIGLAGMGVRTLVDMAVGLKDGLLAGNVALEEATASIQAFTKDGQAAAAIVAEIRKEADKTPFAFNELATATAGLLPAARQAGVAYMDLVRDAEVLAASNPAQGLEGAAFALREAVSGDFTSVIERFNLPRQYINQLKAEGVPAIEIVRRAMQMMGYDADLVANKAQTLNGRWSTFTDTLGRIKDRLTEPIFDRFKAGLTDTQGALDQNANAIDDWTARVAAGIGLVLDGVGALGPAFAGALGVVLDIVVTVGRAIYEALSWLNPFATHSPSLVSQVIDGTQIIADAWENTSGRVAGGMSAVASVQTQLIRGMYDLSDAAGDVGDGVDLMAMSLADAKDYVADLKTELQDAKNAIRDLANTPVAGSKAFEDELFQIEQQTAAVELQINRLKQAGVTKGPELDALEAERERLRLKEEEVRLNEKLTLDPLRKQIKDLAEPVQELDFETITQGILEQQEKIKLLTPGTDDYAQALATLEAQIKQYDQMLAERQKAAGGGGGGGGGGGLFGAGEWKVPPIDTSNLDEFKEKVKRARADIEGQFKPVLDIFRNAKTAFEDIVYDRQPQPANPAAYGGMGAGQGEDRLIRRDLTDVLTKGFGVDPQVLTDLDILRTAVIDIGNAAEKLKNKWVALTFSEGPPAQYSLLWWLEQFRSYAETIKPFIDQLDAMQARERGENVPETPLEAKDRQARETLTRPVENIQSLWDRIKTIWDREETFSIGSGSAGMEERQSQLDKLNEKLQDAGDLIQNIWNLANTPVEWHWLDYIKGFEFPEITVPQVWQFLLGIGGNGAVGLGAGGVVTLPEIKVPDIEWPEITFPEVTVPEITIPEIEWPTVTAPDLSGPLDDVKTQFADRFDEIKEAGQETVDGVNDFFTGLPGKLGATVPSLLTEAGKMGNAIRDGITDGIKGTIGVIGNLEEKLEEALKSLINTAIDAVNNAIPNDLTLTIGEGQPWARSWTVDLPDNPIPHLASGTDNWPGGVAWTGEHGPEMVALPEGSRVFSTTKMEAMLAGALANAIRQLASGARQESAGLTINGGINLTMPAGTPAETKRAAADGVELGILRAYRAMGAA